MLRLSQVLAAFAAGLVLVGSASGASARSGAHSVPQWAAHGFIVFKYLDSLAQIRPGSESGGVLVGGPAGHRLGPHTPWDPALSPNGRFLAFRGYYKPFNEGSFALYVLNLRNGKFRRVTRSVAADPAWSPDGKWIAFDTSGGGEIWKVRATGDSPVRLTRRLPRYCRRRHANLVAERTADRLRPLGPPAGTDLGDAVGWPWRAPDPLRQPRLGLRASLVARRNSDRLRRPTRKAHDH